jgi:iron complex outermembrane receptor protein
MARAQTATEVTVPGARVLRRAAEADGTASTVIAGDRLNRPGQSSADLLRSVPGVQVARSGSTSDVATASLRGATSAQTPIYLSGVLLNDDLGGFADLSTVPLWMIERVEVYRGNAPEHAERLGIGGAILLHPRLPRNDELRAATGIGSFGERSAAVSGVVASERSAALVGVQRSRAQNDYAYLDDQGTVYDTADDRIVRRQNADYDAIDFWALSRHRIGRDASVRSVFNVFQREQGINGFSVSKAEYARTAHRRLLSGVTWTLPYSRQRKHGYQVTTQFSSADATTRDPRSEISSLLTPLLDVSARKLGQSAVVTIYALDALRVRPSVHFSWEQTSLRRVQSESLDASRLTLRPTLSADHEAGRLSVHTLAALECHGTSSRRTDASNSRTSRAEICESANPVGRLGVAYAFLPEFESFLVAGRYVRVPTLGEQFGTSAVVRGNRDLLPESSIGLDVGVRSSIAGSKVSGAAELLGFARETNELIGFQRGSLGIVRPFNVHRSRTLGAEFALEAEAFSHLELHASVTLLDARNTTRLVTIHNDWLPYRAPFVSAVGAEVFAALDEIGIQRVSLAADHFYRAARFGDLAGLVVLPSEHSLDVNLGVCFSRGSLRALATLRNATNEPALDLLGAPLPGRSIHAALEAVLDPSTW